MIEYDGTNEDAVLSSAVKWLASIVIAACALASAAMLLLDKLGLDWTTM